MRPSLLTTGLLALSPFTTAAATYLRLQIPPSANLPNPSLLPPSTTASLTTLSHTYTSPLDTRNSFSFRNVSTGSYLVDIHCSTHSFAPLRIDVSTADEGVVEAWGTFRGNDWNNKGEVKAVVEGADGEKIIEVGPVLGGKNYFQERSGCKLIRFYLGGFGFLLVATFSRQTSIGLLTWNDTRTVSPLSLLKNPMILIGGVSMLVVFGMPYLMDSSTSTPLFSRHSSRAHDFLYTALLHLLLTT